MLTCTRESKTIDPISANLQSSGVDLRPTNNPLGNSKNIKSANIQNGLMVGNYYDGIIAEIWTVLVFLKTMKMSEREHRRSKDWPKRSTRMASILRLS